MKNVIPTASTGTPIINDPGNLSQEMAIYPNAAIMNTIAHTRSYFQLIMRTIVKIHEGIRCIDNPTIVCQKVYPFQKISNANILINAIHTIHAILGNR